MNAIQIPVTIPQGMSSRRISEITEQVATYAQFLFSRVKTVDKQEAKLMTQQEAHLYLDSLSIKDANVPADINGMRDICNTKYL